MISKCVNLSSKLNNVGNVKNLFVFALSTFTFQQHQCFSSKVHCISTASRGIGLEFVNQLLSVSQSNTVVALTRNKNAQGLIDLKGKYLNRLHLVSVDLENQDSIDLAGKEIENKVDKLDTLFNVAGILGGGKNDQFGPERSISGINREWLQKTLDINLMGHVMMTKSLLPLLIKNKGQDLINCSKVVNISARVGSIKDNNLGGWYSYRMSKAALNMFTKTSSLELKR